jgi:cytoskeleton protein RodZ
LWTLRGPRLPPLLSPWIRGSFAPPSGFSLLFHRCYTLILRVERMAKGNFGERLKRERELREVTLEEITSATRIGPRFLEALENEDWGKLPGGVFNRGFVRSVARYLGLDEEAFLAEYDLAHGAQVQPPSEKMEHRIPPPPPWITIAMVLGILLLLLGIITGGMYAWRLIKAHRNAKQALATTLQSPATSDALSTSPVFAAAVSSPAAFVSSPLLPPLELFISVSAATRVRIEADGSLVLDTQLRPGDNHHLSAKDHFIVTAADSSAVLLELNGQAMPPLGTPGASGTMTLTRKNLRPDAGGITQP